MTIFFILINHSLSLSTVCPPGTYRSFELKKCKKCPDNSHSQQPGAAYCQCKSGYFRNKIDPKYVPCLPSPGPPSNLTTIFMDQNSAILSWNYPEAFLRKHHRHHHATDGSTSAAATSTGERMAPVDQWSFDMQFKIKCKQCSDNVVFTPTFEYFNETKLTMTNLEAFSTYSVQVHAHNGPQFNRIKLRKFLDEFIINENQFYANGSASPLAAVAAVHNYRDGDKFITTMIQNKNFSYLMEPLHGTGHGADSDNDLVVVIGNGGAHVGANNFENENFLRLFYKKQQNYFDENQQATDFASLEITTLAHQLTNYHIDNVRVVRKTNKVVEVQWDRPGSLDKKLFQYYEIKWFPRNSNNKRQQQVTTMSSSNKQQGGGGGSGENQKKQQQQQLSSHSGEEPQIERRQTKEERFTISNLMAETEYGIQVRCKMVNGFGQLSMPILWVTTQQQQTQMATPVLDDSGQMQTIAWVVVVFVIVVVAGKKGGREKEFLFKLN